MVTVSLPQRIEVMDQQRPTVNVSVTETAAAGTQLGEPRIHHAVLLTASPLARRLLRVAFVLLAARALGPKQFGVYGLLLAVLEMVAVVSGSGYLDYLTRETAKDAGLGRVLASQLVLLRWLYTVPASIAGIAVLWLLGNSRFVLVGAAYLFLTMAPRAVSEAVQGVLRGIGQYAAFLAVDLVSGLGLVAGGGMLVARGGGLQMAIGTELGSAAAACLVALYFARCFRASGCRWIKWSAVVRASSVFNVYQLVVNLYDRIDVVLLSKLAGDFATGIYSVAYRAMNTIQILPYGVLYSLLPALTRGTWAGASRRQLERAMGLLVCIAFAAVLATTAFATPATLLLLGPNYLESAAALKLLVWAEILMCVNYGLNTALLARGQERVFVVTSLLCLAVNVAGNLIFIPRFSWRAAAALTIITELALLIQNVYWIRRCMGRVPVPHGALRSSLLFVVLMGVVLLGRSMVPPAILGALCLVFFFGYLLKSGMMSEFRSAWATYPTALG